MIQDHHASPTDSYVDAAGRKSSGEGVMKFTDDKTIEWTWTENTPQGKMKLHGTDKKVP